MAGLQATDWRQVPDFDDWGPDTFWTFDDWQNWYYLMREAQGETYARERFTFFYNDPRMRGFLGQGFTWLQDSRKRDFIENVVGIKLSDDPIAGLFSGFGSIVRWVPRIIVGIIALFAVLIIIRIYKAAKS